MKFCKQLLFSFLLTFLTFQNSYNQNYAPTDSIPINFYYKIPIHINVYYKATDNTPGTPTNPTNSYINTIINSTNDILRNRNKNTNGADLRVEFFFDTIDPNGNISNGITRANGSSIDNNYSNGIAFPNYSNPSNRLLDVFGCNNSTGADFINYFNNTQSTWDVTKYFNIYLVNPPTSACNNHFALTFFPQNTLSASSTGAMVSFNDFNPRILAHQLGHALNLYHTYSGDIDETNNLDCPVDITTNCFTKNDFCCDTEPHQRSDSSSDNSCANDLTNWQENTRYNIMNNYSLSTKFTDEQSNRAQRAIIDYLSLSTLVRRINQFGVKLTYITDEVFLKDTMYEVDTNTNFRYAFFNPDTAFYSVSQIKLYSSNDTIPISIDSVSFYTVKNVNKNLNLVLNYSLDTFKNTIIYTSTTNGGTTNISSKYIIRKGLNKRILFFPNLGNLVDSVFVNGIYIQDSIDGITLKNVNSQTTVLVKFAKFVSPLNSFIRNLSKYIVKPNSNLSVIGRNNTFFRLIGIFNNYYGIINSFQKSTINNSNDTNYLINLPVDLEEGLYYLNAGNQIENSASDNFIIRVYHQDSLKVVGWGDNRFGQLNFPTNLNNVVKLVIGNNLISTLTTSGKVIEWGFKEFQTYNPPSQYDNIIDIFSNQNNVRFGLLSTGQIVCWGNDNYVVPDSLVNIVLMGGNDQLNIAVNNVGKIIPWTFNDLPIDYNYLPEINTFLNDTIIDITSGNSYLSYYSKKHRLVNRGIGIMNLFPSIINNVKKYTSNNFSLTVQNFSNQINDYSLNQLNLFNLKYNNNFINFQRGNDFISVLNSDSTVSSFGKSNLFNEVNVPYSLKEIYNIYSSDFFTIALLKNVKLYTKVIAGSGTITPEVTLISLGQNYRINLTPDPGFEVDYIIVDGIKMDYNNIFYDFVNIKLPHSIDVAFRSIGSDGKPIFKLEKNILKAGDTINITGKFCNSFNIRYKNSTIQYNLTPFSIIPNVSETMYRLALPKNLPEGIYLIRAIGTNDTSSIYLLRIYVKDSLIAIGWGDNEYFQSININGKSIIKIECGESANLGLNNSGEVSVWGGDLNTNNLLIPISVQLSKNIVDIFYGQGGQAGVIYNTGKIQVWGLDFNNQNANWAYAKNVIKAVGLEGALVCLTWNNTIEVYGLGDSTYLYYPPNTTFIKKIVDIVGGRKSVTILFEDGTTQTFGNSAIDYGFSESLPLPTQKFTSISAKNFNFIGTTSANNILSFGSLSSSLNFNNIPPLTNVKLGSDFIVGVNADSTIGAYSLTNNYNILDIPSINSVYNVFAGQKHAYALVPYIQINTFIKEGEGIISPTQIIYSNQIGISKRITYQPNQGFAFAYIYVDGQKITDSIDGYTFNNIQKHHKIEVYFIDINAGYLIKLNKYNYKTNERVIVNGRALDGLILKRGNWNDSIIITSFISKNKLNNSDSQYTFNLPSQLTPGVWVVKGVSNSKITNSLLIRIYNNDSLLVAMIGDSTYKLNRIVPDINNVIKIDIGGSYFIEYALALNNSGKVYGWGSIYNNSDFNSSNIPIAVDVFGGNNNQNFLLTPLGTLYGWGNNTFNDLEAPKYLINVIDYVGLGYYLYNTNYNLNIALKQDGSIVAWGKLANTSYINKFKNYNKILKLDGHYGLTDSGQVFDLYDPSTIIIQKGYKIKDIVTRGNNGIAILENDSILIWQNKTFDVYSFQNYRSIGIGNNFISSLKNNDSIEYYNLYNQPINPPYEISPFLRNFYEIICGSNNNLLLFKLNISTSVESNDTTGNISPSVYVSSFINKSRVLFYPKNGYLVDYITVNGKRNYDSLEGYSFENITLPQNISVKFIPNYYPKIVSLTKYIVKVHDTIILRGRNINKFNIISRNYKIQQSIQNILKKIHIPNSNDSLYYFITPKLPDQVYKIVGIGADTVSNIHLIKIYNNDSLLPHVITSADDIFNLRNIPDSITNIVQVGAKSFTCVAMNKDGKIYTWGQNKTIISPSLYNSKNNNAVEFYLGLLGNQIYILNGNGTITAWGQNTHGLLDEEVNDLFDISDLALSSNTGIAINFKGGLQSWGNFKNLYLPYSPYFLEDSFVKIRAGQFHFLTLSNKDKIKSFGDPSYTNFFNNNYPDTVNNRFIDIDANNDFLNSAIIKKDSSIISWGINSNGFGANNTSILGTGNDKAVRGLAFSASLKNEFVKLALDPNDENVLIVPVNLYNVKSIEGLNNGLINLFSLNITPQVKNPEGGNTSDTVQLSQLYKNYQVRFFPNKGYLVDSIWINNIYANSDSLQSYTFTNITLNQKVLVSFKLHDYQINSQIVNGFFNPIVSNPLTTNITQQNTYYYFPNNNRFLLDSVLINGILINDSLQSFTFKNVDTNSTIKIVYKVKKYSITANVENGNSNIRDTLIEIDSNFLVKFYPQIGYELDSVFIDGVYDPTISDSFYLFTNIINHHTILIKFKIKKFPIYTSVINGLVSKPQTANFGSKITITYQPENISYEFYKIVINDVEYFDSINSFTIENLTDTINISVYFEIKKYRIKVSVINGFLNGIEGKQVIDTIINYHESICFNYNPLPLYIFGSIYLNGIDIGSDSISKYCFNIIEDSQFLEINYRKAIFDIVPIVIGGTISPLDTQHVYLGESVRFIYNPFPNYIIDSILFNNKPLTLDSTGSYTLDNIKSDGIFKVIFKELISNIYAIITPNNDGINDFLNIFKIDKFTQNSIEIYNSNGHIVKTFLNFNYLSQWRGTDQYGNPLDNGNYFYILKLYFQNKIIFVKKGYFIIYRP